MRKLFLLLIVLLTVFALASCNNDPASAHDHSWGDGEITTNPTCTTAGVKTFTCSCGEKKTEYIAPTGHNYQAGDNGNGKTVIECSRCHDSYSVYKEYSIGSTGPGGGKIFYDCDADNGTGNADGLTSAECGWRYLEAAPADLGAPTNYIFGYNRTSDAGSNLVVNGTSVYNEADCTGIAIGIGKANTALLVAAMGEEAYSASTGSEKTSNYAAKLCADYSYGGKDDWFLPSFDELKLMEDNRATIGGFADYEYWSSYETSSGGARIEDFSCDSMGDYYRDDACRVRPIRSF